MFARIFTVAAATTLLSAIPLYFLATADYQLTTSSLPIVLLAIFAIALIAGALATTGNHQPSDGNRESGEVKWFNANKGFGFITRDNGEDIFVHFRSIRGKGRRVLRDGQRVEFVVAESDKGLQAEDVAAAN